MCKKGLAESYFEKWHESGGDVVIATRADSVLDIIDMFREYDPDICLSYVHYSSEDDNLYSICVDEDYDLIIDSEDVDGFADYEYLLPVLDPDDPDLNELLGDFEEANEEEPPVHGFTWSYTDTNGIYRSGSFYSSDPHLVLQKMKEYNVNID